MIKIPIEIGDTVYVGRFKNKKIIVKSITYNEYGLPMINGRPLLTLRIEKLMPTKQKNETMKLQTLKNIIREIFLFEKEPSEGYTILYRAAKIELDSLIDGKNIRSLSLNMSILSGFINDKTACTLFLIQSIPKSGINNKIKYTIKKFNIFNKSNEYSLFFIPPIHPFLQLYCEGELWHPRTKIGYDYFESLSIFDERSYTIIGIGCRNNFIRDSNYLKSDKTVEELETLYQQYKSTGQISIWQKKYLKYKNKYLELKNKYFM